MSYLPHEEAAGDSAGQLSIEERVQKRAYELYVLRGNESGSEMEDWLQAEDEVRDAEEHGADRE